MTWKNDKDILHWITVNLKTELRSVIWLLDKSLINQDHVCNHIKDNLFDHVGLRWPSGLERQLLSRSWMRSRVRVHVSALSFVSGARLRIPAGDQCDTARKRRSSRQDETEDAKTPGTPRRRGKAGAAKAGAAKWTQKWKEDVQNESVRNCILIKWFTPVKGEMERTC